jgi:hypothetical protein
MTQSSLTPKPRYTFQRNSIYYFRYTLPPDVSKVVSKQGLRYSLKTGYIKQAERKARRLAGTIEEFIFEVRQEPHIIINLSEAQIQTLLDQHLRQSLNNDELYPVSRMSTLAHIRLSMKDCLTLFALW